MRKLRCARRNRVSAQQRTTAPPAYSAALAGGPRQGCHLHGQVDPAVGTHRDGAPRGEHDRNDRRGGSVVVCGPQRRSRPGRPAGTVPGSARPCHGTRSAPGRGARRRQHDGRQPPRAGPMTRAGSATPPTRSTPPPQKRVSPTDHSLTTEAYPAARALALLVAAPRLNCDNALCPRRDSNARHPLQEDGTRGSAHGVSRSHLHVHHDRYECSAGSTDHSLTTPRASCGRRTLTAYRGQGREGRR